MLGLLHSVTPFEIRAMQVATSATSWYSVGVGTFLRELAHRHARGRLAAVSLGMNRSFDEWSWLRIDGHG